MALPNDMPALEERLYTLMGDRMVEEPVQVLQRFADRQTWSMIRALAKHVDQPIAHLFALPWLDSFHERVSPREWRAFASTLLDWAGEEGVLAAPLAFGSTKDLPPAEWRPLAEWTREHGLEDRMRDPASAILPFAELLHGPAPLSPFPTVRAVLDASSKPRAGITLRDPARAYLAYCAGRLQQLERRRSLLARPAANPTIGAARARLVALIELLTPVEPPPPLVAEEVRLHLDEETMRLHLEHDYRTGWGKHQVWVSLIERATQVPSEGEGRALTSVAGPVPDSALGVALRVAAERALDALIDPEDVVHDQFVSALERPTWSRMLEALQATLSEPQSEAVAPDERLVWRVGDGDGRVTITAALQKRGKRGWSRGRHVEIREVADRADTDERDRRVAEAALARRRSYVVDVDRGALLRALVGHPRVVFEDQVTRSVRVRRATLEIRLRDEDDGQTSVGFSAGDVELSARALLEGFVETGTFARVVPGRGELLVAPVSPTLLEVAKVCARYGASFPRKADEALLELLARLPADVGVEVPPRVRGEATPSDATPRVRLEPLPGGGLRAQLGVRPLEEGPTHPPGEGPRHIFLAGAKGRRYAERDLPLERRRADEIISALHLDHAEPDGRFAWLLDDPEEALTFLDASQQLGEAVRLEWPEGTDAWAIVRGSSTFKVRTKSMKDWFALRGELRIDEESVSLAALMSALRAGRRFVEMTPGRFARISDELAGKLSAIDDVAFDEADEMVLAPELATRLRELLPETELAPDPDFDGMCERLLASAERPLVAPTMNAELRGYQAQGTEWLLRTAAWARGAILADDMGLGKTLQALTLLSARASMGPAIVVCPTSVADNWAAEASRFASEHLEVRIYRGPDRHGTLDGLGPGQVLVTSYDVMVRDADALIELPFATAVFDEAQLLKNPDTQRRKVARRLNADFSLALSGTPLENHLGELWSIFDVLVPGLLGPWKRFRDRFAGPIERHGNKERLEALRSLLAPFLLRRTKREVAPELPPRTEVVRAIELSTAEQALYEAERRRALESLAGGDDPKKRFAILAALTRLRRIACHPALVDGGSTVRSSKLDELMRLADDLVREGHRALLFSQFTSHLALVRTALEDAGHETLYLDGDTPGAERSNLVRRFQEGAMPFFLISLKAGGTGLNLTAADTVIHLDPWWNPAVEDQASDRTHRIGQTKPVTVIRLVAQGTIEETVLELHGEKRELARGLLEGAENNARLDTKELLSLLGN